MKKNKCILVHTPQLLKNSENTLSSTINFCAMGLYSLAGELEKENIQTEIIHLGVEKYLDSSFQLSDYIKQNEIKFIAFSLHWHPQSYDVIETIRCIKEKNPDIFVMLGGFTASYFAEEILKNFKFIDAIIKGEGESPIRLLAKKVLNNDLDLAEIPNLSWRKNNKIITNQKKYVASDNDLDSFEFFNIEKMKNYSSYTKIPFFLNYSKDNELNNPMTSQGICLGRGCTGNCTWCGGGCEATKLVTGRDFISFRSPENVISEIKMLKEKCNIEVFRFAFDPTPEDRTQLLTLINRIADEFHGKLTTTFSLFGLPDKKILDAYKRAFSKESIMAISPEFHNENLRKFHKSFYYSNQELEEILEYMEKLELKSELYFSIIPCVEDFENKKSEKYAQKLKNRFKYIEKYYIIPIVYEPAAPWTITPQKYGLKFKPKTFLDYYNDTKNVKNSFENINDFRRMISSKNL